MTAGKQASISDILSAPTGGQRLFGRARELEQLAGILDGGPPIVTFLYGLPGIGKSALLSALYGRAHARGIRVLALDGSRLEPTAAAFTDSLAGSLGVDVGEVSGALEEISDTILIAIDNYQALWLLDGWFRDQFLPSLPSRTRVVLATSNLPGAAWTAREPWHSQSQLVELEPLSAGDALACLKDRGLSMQQAQHVYSVVDGYPMALVVAASTANASLSRSASETTTAQLLTNLAAAYLNGIERLEMRQLLMEVAALRRVNVPLLSAIRPDEDPRALFDELRELPLTTEAEDGLAVHDAVRGPLVANLAAQDPARERQVKRAAWSVLATDLREAQDHNLWRFTADTIYLLSDPVVREAFFRKDVPFLDVAPADSSAEHAIIDIAERHDSAEEVRLTRMWWKRMPGAFKVVLNREGEVEGFYFAVDSSTAPPAAVGEDPLTRAWCEHLSAAAVPSHQRALYIRRWLSRQDGEAPSGVQAAAWLDMKRTYLEMRPSLRHVYLTLRDLAPYGEAAARLGFCPSPGLSAQLGDAHYAGAVLDMGPASVDGWLHRLLARELGIGPEDFLDPERQAIMVDGEPVTLTQLEFKVAAYLYANAGSPVSRDRLLDNVWGLDYHGGSNVVDAVIKSLRRKMGTRAGQIKTVRGHGYALDLG